MWPPPRPPPVRLLRLRVLSSPFCLPFAPAPVRGRDFGKRRDRRQASRTNCLGDPNCDLVANGREEMATWTPRTTIDASPEEVLAMLTDPAECPRWSPISFDVEYRAEPVAERSEVFARLEEL